MKSMCCCVIWSKMPVRTAAGVTQLTRMPVLASSLPSDLVSPITAAFDALYADAFGIAFLARDRGDVDDAPVVALRRMIGHHGAVAQEDAVHVDVEHPLPGVDRIVRQRRRSAL